MVLRVAQYSETSTVHTTKFKWHGYLRWTTRLGLGIDLPQRNSQQHRQHQQEQRQRRQAAVIARRGMVMHELAYERPDQTYNVGRLWVWDVRYTKRLKSIT